MSCELRRGQSMAKNLRTLFRRQIEGALRLTRSQEEPGDTLVHEVRKHLKKARAVLNLVRPHIGGRAFRRQDRKLRDVGRSMKEIRDAEVRLQTMRELEDVTHHHYRSYQKIEAILAVELEDFHAAFGGWETGAVALLKRADELAAKWPITGYTEKQLGRAMKRAYKSGRKTMAAARSDSSAANLHELRKRVKLLGYQVGIVQPWNHIVIGEAHAELIDLGHLLGRVHDLIFLADRLRLERREKHWGKQDDELLATIEASETALRRDGIELADRFFAERPRKFRRHIDEWFKDRRHADENQVAEALVNA